MPKRRKKDPNLLYENHACTCLYWDNGRPRLYAGCQYCARDGRLSLWTETVLLNDEKKLARAGLILRDCICTPEVWAEVMKILGRAEEKKQEVAS